MCVSCHHAYDQTHESAGFYGRTQTPETRRKISEARKGKSWLYEASPEQRAEFGSKVSAGRKQNNEYRAIKQWAVLRYPDMIVYHGKPSDEIIEAWKDYCFWQQFSEKAVNQDAR